MARVEFDQIFKSYPDGFFEPRERININGKVLKPGEKLRSGAMIAGVDFSLFAGNDLEVRYSENEIPVIVGTYEETSQ